MSTYILLDGMNLFHRAKWGTKGDIDAKSGMCLHIILNSIKAAYRDLGGDHVVLFREGRSWRKTAYQPYKANRAIEQAKKSQTERDEDQILTEVYSEFEQYITEKTNATVLRCPIAEADDLIAMWIELHPNDNHIIVSSDTDFVQLLAPNVQIYNGLTEFRYTHEAVYDSKKRRHSFTIDNHGKIKIGKHDDLFESDRDWINRTLFVKCIRGDKSDNIFPAYPGARYQGSKNKTGILEAYEDKDNGGYNWNNFMLQTWTDADGNVRTVKDEYERNRKLIDLKMIPEDVKLHAIECILSEIRRPRITNVGVHFLKFCGAWGLNNIAKYPDEFVLVLNAAYRGPLLEEAA